MDSDPLAHADQPVTAGLPGLWLPGAAVVGDFQLHGVAAAAEAHNRQERLSAGPIGTVAVFDNAGKGGGAADRQSFPDNVVEGVRSALPAAQLFQIGVATCADGCVVQLRAPPPRPGR